MREAADVAALDEAQRQLEASADDLSLVDQRAAAAPATGEALDALRQLKEAGEAQEAPQAAAPAPPELHKSASEAAAVLDRNLASLAGEYPSSLEGSA